MGGFVVGFFGVKGLEVFARDFGEGAVAVVDLDGWGGAAGRWGVSFGDIGIGRSSWLLGWCMSQA